MRRELFTPVGDRVQRNARGRARLGALAVTTGLGLVISVTAALPASATRAPDERHGGTRTPVAVSCHVVESTVVAGRATFTVGPRGCEGRTPPLSFSTYTLKDGLVLPYTSQVAFAHATGNGATYGAGSYALEAALPDCNWQSDLYIGQSQPSAPHIHPLGGMNVGWDFQEGKVCAPADNPSPSPSATPSTPPPSPAPTPSESPAVVPSPSPTATTPAPTPSETPDEVPSPSSSAAPTSSPSPSVAPSAPSTPVAAPSATPTPTATAPTPSAAPTSRSEVLSAGAPAPTPTPTPSVTYVSEVLDAQANLAATGSSTGPVLGGAAVLLVAGGLLVTLRRRSGQRP